MTVGELKERMSWREFQEWQAFYVWERDQELAAQAEARVRAKIGG